MKFIYKLIVFGIILFFINTTFNISTAQLLEKQNIKKESENFNGYIIQFFDDPIISYKKQFQDKVKDFLNEKVQKHKNELVLLHKKAKNEILNIIDSFNKNKQIFSNEFYNLFNGLCIDEIDKESLQLIENLSYVKEIIPNYKIKINLDKSTPLIGANDVWNYHDINDKNIAGYGIRIAIIDTGVDYNHPDLNKNYVGGYDFVNDDNDPMDDNGHGTHCAGIALGTGINSNYKYTGVAPRSDLFSYKVLDNEGNGEISSVIDAFDRALEEDIDIISISFGNNEELAFPNSILSLAADNVVDAGIVVVAAAGNDGKSGQISSPACAKKVICVGATDKNDNVADFSSRGPAFFENGSYLIKPDIVAPGVNIKSCSKNNGYIYLSGTSMSTPHVAGASALILQENPLLTPEQVKNILKENALDLGFDKNISGNGRIEISSCIEFNDEIIIKSPFRVNEGDNFEVSIFNKNSTPLNSFVIFYNPYHLPNFKYGSSLIFNAPNIIIPSRSELKSSIFIINKKNNIFKRYDILVSNKYLITH